MADSSADSTLLDRLRTPAVGLLIGLAVAAVVLLVRSNGHLFLLEARLADWMIRRGPHADAKQSPVVVVAITERDIRAWQQYPISDRKMAELIETLLAAKPRAIGIDVYRDVITPDVRPGSSPAEDRARLMGLIKSKPLISTVYLNASGDSRVDPPPELLETNRLALSMVVQDSDGRTRRAALFGADDVRNRSEPTLSLATAARYLRAEQISMKPVENDPDSFAVGKAVIGPLDATYGFYGGALSEHDRKGQQLVLDYAGPKSFERYGVEQVLSDPALAARIADRIVLIGVITLSNKDTVASPISDEMPGVELHAHAAEQLIRAARTGVASRRTMPDEQEIAYTILASIVAAGAAMVIRSQLGSIPALGVILVAIVYAGWFAFQRNYLIPVVPPLASAAVSGGLTTAYVAFNQRRQRRVLMSLFGKTVSPAVADELWRQRRELISSGTMRPRQMTATVLFFDLKGFTSIAEKTDPAVMIDLLNELFEEMATAIERHGGVVNKFVGDQIMALFGPPRLRTNAEEHKEDATNAVRCAVELRRKLVAINDRWQPLGRPQIFMRVGIYTGPLVAGSVGSRDRLEYTVIGDTVNTASRLESAGKDLFNDEIAPGGCRIFIGQPTLAAVDGQFRIQKVEIGELKGKSEGVAVYAVLD